jgi:hypothetical protein
MMTCTCCGGWRIEHVQLALAARQHRRPTLRLARRTPAGWVPCGEFGDVESLAGKLRMMQGPDLARFAEDAV